MFGSPVSGDVCPGSPGHPWARQNCRHCAGIVSDECTNRVCSGNQSRTADQEPQPSQTGQQSETGTQPPTRDSGAEPAVGPPVRSALDSGWLLQVAAVVVAVETAVRIWLGSTVHPFLYLLAPPVVAVVGVGRLAPTIRTRVLGLRNRYALDTGDTATGRLLLLAVIGHAVAVVLGTALFVLVDTPLQALVYALGVESRPPFVALARPLFGVFLGTVLVWTPLVVVLAGISEGLSVSRSVGCALVVIRSQSVLPVLVANLLGVLGAVAAFALAYPLALSANSLRLLFAVGGVFTVVFCTVPFAVATLAHLGAVRALCRGADPESVPDENPTADDDTVTRGTASTRAGTSNSDTAAGTGAFDPPVATLALVFLLTLSLATLAAGVRVAELRPTESPDSLGDDPDDMYATALTNTLEEDHTVRRVIDPGTADERRTLRRYDRTDRQIQVHEANVSRYVSTGVQNASPYEGSEQLLYLALIDRQAGIDERRPHTPSNYFRWRAALAERDLVGPLRGVTGWEQVNDTAERVVLELTNRRAAFEFAAPNADPDRFDVVDREIRAVVNKDTQTLVELDIRFEAVLRTPGPDDTRRVVNKRYTFETGIDLERPARFGSPTTEEYVWRTLLY